MRFESRTDGLKPDSESCPHMRMVWLLNHYAQEPGGPGGTRHFSLAYHLRKHGWNAFIIAASVELNTNRQRLTNGEHKRIERFDDVPFLWLRTPQYGGNGGGRIFNMLTYSARALVGRNTEPLPRPDIIIGSSVHPFAACSGAILAHRFRIPFIFEVRDLWPQTLIDLRRMSENGLPARMLRALEKWLYRRADRIVTLLPRARDYIEPLGIGAEKIVWLPNGVDLSDFPCFPSRSEGAEFVLMYFGAHGNANGLDNVLDAMAELGKRVLPKSVRLRLIGDGPLKQDLISRAAALSLDNVSFEPPVPKAQIPTLAAEADAFVFNLVDAPVFKYGISSNKLFDFMAAARPIIFCCNASNNPIAEANAGLSLPPGQSGKLADAIEALIAMPEGERAAMGQRARVYVEQTHDYGCLAQRLAAVCDELAGVRPVVRIAVE